VCSNEIMWKWNEIIINVLVILLILLCISNNIIIINIMCVLMCNIIESIN